MSKTRIPFKSSNNKKSPVNVNNNENEIDVNVLLNDPKSLHKMLNKKSDDNDYVPTNVNPNKLSNRPKEKDNRSPITFFKEEGSKMLNKRFPKKEKDDIPEFAPYVKKKYNDKREYNRAGEILNKGVSTLQDTTVKGYDKGKELINDFIKDSKKDGVGETLNNRKNKMEDLIVDFMKNNKTLQKLDGGAKKLNRFLEKYDSDFSEDAISKRHKKKN